MIVGPDFAEVAEKAVAPLERKPKLIALGFDRPGFVRDDVWLAGAEARDPNLAIAGDDDVIQLYTSGTTGLPKGVRLTHDNYLDRLPARRGRAGTRLRRGRRRARRDAVLPRRRGEHRAHGHGQRGGTAIVRDFAPGPTLGLIAREKVNHAFLAPAMILMLMQAPEMAGADLSSMKTLAYGASPIAEDLSSGRRRASDARSPSSTG